MSFFGGGTDLPQFYEEHGGAVISTTFDKYCYVNVRHLPRFFDYSTELSYSKIERVTDVNDIVHPAVREAMKYLDMREIRLTYEADLPARSGLGTSSSFAVGMLNAFYALKGKYADKRKLAEDAIYLERVLCQEAGGLQDQIAAAYGGFNRIDFKGDGWDVRPLILVAGPHKPFAQRFRFPPHALPVFPGGLALVAPLAVAFQGFVSAPPLFLLHDAPRLLKHGFQYVLVLKTEKAVFKALNLRI
jgi:galactokinase/mevalonate kinase-like predicted kinase